MTHPLEQIVNQVITVMTSVPVPLVYLIAMGWLGLEGVGIPVPLTPILLFLGSLAGLGHVNLPMAIGLVCLGTLAGASVAYYIGKRFGTIAAMRYGRHVGLTPARVQHIDLWLRRRGSVGVFLLRLPPGVRSFTPLVEGEAGTTLPAFILGTVAGALVVNSVYALVGAALGANYRTALAFVDRLQLPILLTLVAVIAVVVGFILLHRFWAKLTWHRLHLHFHRYHAALASQSPVAAGPAMPGGPAGAQPSA